MHWYTIAVLPLLVFILWMYTSLLTQRFPVLESKRILLLIAHPDDEAMFFGPTLLALTKPELRNNVKILCLSSGDADGLGEVRKKELVKSGLVLGLSKSSDVQIIEDPNFPDSMTTNWDPKLISKLLTKMFAPKMASLSTSEAPATDIDVILTFDADGVSNHPNHRSLYHGSIAFIKSLMQGRSGWEFPITLYTLTSVPFWRKYLGVLDAVTTLFDAAWTAGSSTGNAVAKKEITSTPNPLVFVSGVKDWRIAQNAMTTAHVSQMRWFRWGWIGLSRYMVVNDLKKEKIR